MTETSEILALSKEIKAQTATLETLVSEIRKVLPAIEVREAREKLEANAKTTTPLY